MKKEEAIKKIQESKDSEGFEVYSADEHKTFLENYEKSVVDPRVREIHDQYDKDILDITGKKRAQDQKSYDFLKQILASGKGNEQKVKDLETEIADLKQQIKDGKGDEKIRAELEQAQKDLKKVQDTYKTEKETWDKEKTSMLADHEKVRLSNVLDRALMGIKFKEGITEQVRNIMVETIKNELIASAEIVEGKMIFKNDKGETLRNKNNALNPYTPEEMVREKLKDIIETGKKIEGPEEKPTIIEDKDGKKTVNYVPADGVKTKDQLHKDLLQRGFVHGSEEYKLAYAKYAPDLKYTE